MFHFLQKLGKLNKMYNFLVCLAFDFVSLFWPIIENIAANNIIKTGTKQLFAALQTKINERIQCLQTSLESSNLPGKTHRLILVPPFS